MYLDIVLSIEAQQRIKELVQDKVDEIIAEDTEYVKELALEVLKGAIKNEINNAIQSTNYRNILRDRILKQLKLGEIDERQN